MTNTKKQDFFNEFLKTNTAQDCNLNEAIEALQARNSDQSIIEAIQQLVTAPAHRA